MEYLAGVRLLCSVPGGVGAKVASEVEIKAAYKRKALIVHPDKHSDSDEATRRKAEEEFKKIGEALEILGDSMKRGLYDEGFDREAIEERVARCVPCGQNAFDSRNVLRTSPPARYFCRHSCGSYGK